MPNSELQFRREVLLAAIREVAATANEEAHRGNDPIPLRAEAKRLTARLVKLQGQMEENDCS